MAHNREPECEIATCSWPLGPCQRRCVPDCEPETNHPKENTMTTHTELATGKAETIAADANYIRDLVHDREVRYDNARDAGAELASDVYLFLDDPEGVGTDALRAAYDKFMGRHSGNFGESRADGS